MEISKSSWHYRLWRKLSYEYRPPHDLCHYFWSIVGNLIFLSTITLIVLAILGFFIHCCIIMTTEGWMIISFFISTTVLSIFTIGGLRKLLGRPLWMPGSDILSEFLKAKKQRVCPLIEYMD